MKKTAKFLKENKNDRENFKEALENYRLIRSTNGVDAAKEVNLFLTNIKFILIFKAFYYLVRLAVVVFKKLHFCLVLVKFM